MSAYVNSAPKTTTPIPSVVTAVWGEVRTSTRHHVFADVVAKR